MSNGQAINAGGTKWMYMYISLWGFAR